MNAMSWWLNRRQLIASGAASALVGLAGCRQTAKDEAAAKLLSQLEDHYRELSYYTDRTDSRLLATKKDGSVRESRNTLEVAFDRESGLLIDGLINTRFVIEDWEAVTSHLKSPGRITRAELGDDDDWTSKLAFLGSFVPTEHPMLDFMTRSHLSKTTEPFFRASASPRLVGESNGNTMVSLSLPYSSQGVNFGALPEDSLVDAVLEIDRDNLLVRSIRYDLTKSYSETFGDIEAAEQIVTFSDIALYPDSQERLQIGAPTRPFDDERPWEEVAAASFRYDDTDTGMPSDLVGRQAPLFSLPLHNGGSTSLDDYVGQRLILFFWGTWCNLCAIAVEEVQQILDHHAGQITMLPIHIGPETDRIPDYQARRGLNFQSAVDDTGEVASAYRVVGTPAYIVIGPSGLIEMVDFGTTEALAERLL